MTTPGQMAPDGAYQIGGGSNAYGQGLTDASAAHLMLGGFTSIASFTNPLDGVASAMGMFADALLKLPLDVLKLFEPLIPGDLGAVFNTVGGAVGAIVSHFQTLGPLLTSTFNSFITTSYNILSSAFQQILDIVNGLLVTPINSAVSGFKDWFTGLMGSTLPDLGTAVSGAVNQVSDLIHNLLTAPSTVLGNIPQTLVTGLGGALNDINSFVNGVVNAIISAIRGIPFVGGSIADGLAALAGAVTTQQSQAQNFTISALATGYRNPAHICRYPVGDVSFSEELLASFAVFGTTSAQSAGTAHTHGIDGNSTTASGSTWTILQNTAIGGYITTSNTAVYDTVGVGVVKVSGTLNNVFLEIFREDEDGSLSRVFSQDISAGITTGLTYIEASIPSVIIAQAGERYMVRVRNASTVNTVMAIAGMQQYTMAVDNSIIFSNATQANQTSYSAADAATYRAASNTLPWALLASKNAVEPELSFPDNFDRQFLGPDWITDGLTLVDGQMSYGGTVDGVQTSFFIRRTTRDAQKVSGNLHIGTTATTQRAALRMHFDREGTQSVELSVSATDAKIYSYLNGTATQRATVAVGGADFYELYYDETNDKYVALKNGATFGLQWTGVGSSAKHGSRYRFAGTRIARASGINAALIDNFEIADYAA